MTNTKSVATGLFVVAFVFLAFPIFLIIATCTDADVKPHLRKLGVLKWALVIPLSIIGLIAQYGWIIVLTELLFGLN